MQWLKDNGWAIAISFIALASSFSLYGYRISALETRATVDEHASTKLSQTVDDTNLQTQVSLAKIQTDIEYIKMQLSKIVK